jgi:6-phosphogluconate dehydrogenase (decarboxylating)
MMIDALGPIEIKAALERKTYYVMDLGEGRWEVAFCVEAGYQFANAADAVVFIFKSAASMRVFAGALAEAAGQIERETDAKER